MRVLIVEDEPSMANSLRIGLESEGYIVDVALDGLDGLWRVTEFSYDAMVLDIMLPGLNGFLVARRVREAGCDVPILMLSAKDGDLDQAEALDTGADDFLGKPFSYPLLLARLRALIRRSSARPSSVVVIDDLRLDLAAHRRWRGEVEIELTAREDALLAYLAHRAGEVVSKAELLRHVWPDEDTDANAVEVYIGYLRRKIDAPFGRATIQTVRGRGYRLASET